MKAQPARVPWGRRIFLLDRDFQMKYAFILGCIGTLVIGLSAIVMYVVRRRAMSDLEIPGSLASELATREAVVLWALAGLALVTGVVLGLIGVMITHRIAGPVYVMTQSVAALARGQYPPNRTLRKHDDLKDFVELFQKSIDSMRARDVEETFKLEEAILRLAPYETDLRLKEVLTSLRALRDTKSTATGHLSASSQFECHPTPERPEMPIELPLRLVGKEDLGQ